jgi:hypothetical protein
MIKTITVYVVSVQSGEVKKYLFGIIAKNDSINVHEFNANKRLFFYLSIDTSGYVAQRVCHYKLHEEIRFFSETP